MRAETGTLRQLLGFLIVGGLNTMFTGALFVSLALVWPISLAYSFSFAVGVGIAVALTPRIAFGVKKAGHGQRSRYAAWYLLVFMLGLGMVSLLREVLNVATVTAAMVTFVMTAGLSFVGARFLFPASPMRTHARFKDTDKR